MRLDFDRPVDCADGAFGELADVIIDPGRRSVTHVVVQPRERHDLGRLVPIARVRAGPGIADRVALTLTDGQLNELEPLHDTEYIRLGERPSDPRWDVGVEAISQMPLSGSLGVNALGPGTEPTAFDPHATLSFDRIPKGTVEIRRASDVVSADGHRIGNVIGVVIDEGDGIAELITEHGHLWRKREIAIPNASIDRIESDEVILAVSYDLVVALARGERG